MEKLRKFLNSLSRTEQEAFARRVGTSLGYLRKAISTCPKMDIELMAKIERATGGAVRCEDLRPDVDWAVLRGTCAETAARDSGVTGTLGEEAA